MAKFDLISPLNFNFKIGCYLTSLIFRYEQNGLGYLRLKFQPYFPLAEELREWKLDTLDLFDRNPFQPIRSVLEQGEGNNWSIFQMID